MKKQTKSFRFEAVFTPQDEGGFTVEVPALPGCISEGDTLKEAEAHIREAVELYLETLKERGMPLPQRPKFKVLKMNLSFA